MPNFDLKKFVEGLISRAVTRLFLSFIYIIEEMVADGRVSEEEFKQIRKKILDSGNGCIRDINAQLENFDFLLSKD